MSAAVLLAALWALPQGHASPAATSEVVAAGGGSPAKSVRATNKTSTPTGTTDSDTTDSDTTDSDTTDSDTTGADTGVDDPKPLDPDTVRVVEQHEEHQLHAVPPPLHAVPLPRRWGLGDKRLRHDRGMLAAGSIFAAVCGVGAGLSIWALIDRRSRPYGPDTSDAVAAVSGLLSCTVGAVALAAVGAARLKKRRG